MKIDQRKRYFLVLDTETTSPPNKNSLAMPIIYDLAWSVCDRQGKIYEQANLLIKNIYTPSLMASAYYACKIPLYEKMLKYGETTPISFTGAIDMLNDTLSRYNNITLCAYNLSFDLRALSTTASFTSHPDYTNSWEDLFDIVPPIQDIWSMYVETVMVRQKGYEYFIQKHNLYTPAGNPKSSAEVGYQFLINDIDFIEDHTALSDTQIEVALLAHGLSQRKAYTKGIKHHPWRLLKHLKSA